MPNPTGSDDTEWIELYNKGSQSVDLSGFSLQDNSTRLFVLDEDSGLNLNLNADSFLLLKKMDTKISLNNTGGDSVKLYNPSGELLDKAEYIDTALEGRSYARKQDTFLWTAEPSPGDINIFVDNQPPSADIILKSEELLVGAKIILSAEGSSDPEEGDLKYIWDFGDEISGDEKTESHIYDASGNYIVKLKVIDSEGLSDDVSMLLKIFDIKTDIKLEEIAEIIFDLSDLIISEFVPNPVGSDETEWIEIYNNSDEDINLLGWQIDDQEGGSKPYVIKEETIIGSKSFLIIKREDSKITLNNSNDSVRLLNPLGEVWQEVSYEKIPEGKSQAWDLDNQEWFEARPSPGELNIFYQSIEPEYIYSVWESKELAKGDDVLVQGVILEGAQENSTSLYLSDWDGSSVDYSNLIEVYAHAKNFPEFKKGQLVTVSGEISKEGSLPRIKIKTSEQIWSNDLEINMAEPEILELEDVIDDYFDSWQKIRGVVVKKSGKNIYLATSEDEDYILRVYNKNPNKDIKIEKGQEIIASGLLVDTDSLPKLIVFDPSDILLSQEVLGEKIENIESQEQDLEEATSTEYKVESKNENKQLILVGFIFLLLIILLYFVNKKYIRKT